MLPWRQEVTPYRVWISEIMLQQTRVESALPYYERFLSTFPDVETLAAAPLEDVLKCWEKLGYYSRARNLHRAARIIVEELKGVMPQTAAEWLALPGVGRYTAGAIASVCHDEPVPILDGNVKRVLARLFAVDGPIDSHGTVSHLWALAEEIVPSKQAGNFNQAIMELGATLCSPRNPKCSVCPVEKICIAREQGRQHQLPIRKGKKPVPHKHVVAAIIETDGALLLGKRPESGMLGGLWEFPGGKVEEGETPQEALKREMQEECGVLVEVGEHVTSVDHAYTHFTITLHVYRCRIVEGELHAKQHTELKWIARPDLQNYPLPAADHKFLHLL